MRLDCEIISQDFLPALRSALAKELSTGGMSQKSVADLLGISQPAVSQYLRDLRGAKNNFITDEELLSSLKKFCEKIIAKELDEAGLKENMYSICKMALDRKKKARSLN